MMMNSTQLVAKPLMIQPITPSATAVVKKIFLVSLWSAMAPRTGPISATTTVTIAMAME